MVLELRDIEIFLTVAEELHFGRAAQGLHISPARVSQAIKKQERYLGGALFERSTRWVRLTPFGQSLRDELAPQYQGLRASLTKAKLSAQHTTTRLRVGSVPPNVLELRPIWETFRLQHPECHLELRSATWVDPFAGLRRGDIDVLVMALPVEEPDLTVGPVILTDTRALAVASNHALAENHSVSVEVLADFPHTTAPQLPDYWEASFIPFHTPKGRVIERGPVVRNRDEMFTATSTGEAVTMLGSHGARYWARPDIAWVSVHDLPRLNYPLIWRTDAENDQIRPLSAIATDLGPQEL